MQRKSPGKLEVSSKFRFTEAALRALPLEPATYVDADTPWLICRIGAKTRTLYVRRKQRGTGRLVFHRLGELGDRPLAALRIEGERIAGELNRGNVPAAAVQRGVKSLGELLEAYIEARKGGDQPLAATTIKSYRADAEDTFGPLSRPITALDPDTVAREYRARSAKTKARADGGLRILRALYRFALKAAEGRGEPPPFARDPLALITAAKAWNAPVRRSTRLKKETRPAWVKAVRALPDDDGKQNMSGTQRDALLLLAATGLRLREALHLRWGEVDLQSGLVRISGERMKGNREHVVPLAKRTLAMLKARRAADPSGDFVFVGRKSKGKVRPLDQISRAVYEAIPIDFTPHDLRRTVATFLALRAPVYVAKAVLSHADPARDADVTRGYVDEEDTDPVRDWLQAWEDALYRAR
jgi:integrase